jgi:GxxExxY protein
VHKELGPGLLESVYERCFAYELSTRGHAVEIHKEIPIVYHNIRFEMGFRADLIVDSKVLIEVKAIDQTASDSPCSSDHISEAHRIADRPPCRLQRPNA